RRALASSRMSIRVSARLAPFINPLTGLIDERALVTLGASYQQRELTTAVLLGASGSVNASNPAAESLVNGELSAGYALTKRVAFDAGIRGLWQRQETTGAAFSVAALFIGVTLRAPPARL